MKKLTRRLDEVDIPPVRSAEDPKSEHKGAKDAKAEEPLHQRVIKRAGRIRSVSYGRALAGLFGDWITRSTRRLRWRPALLLFEATG